jgi:hypothetical protein
VEGEGLAAIAMEYIDCATLAKCRFEQSARCSLPRRSRLGLCSGLRLLITIAPPQQYVTVRSPTSDEA